MIIRVGRPSANDHPDFILSTRFFTIFIFSKFLIFLQQTPSSPSKHFFVFFFKSKDQGSIFADLSRTCSQHLLKWSEKWNTPKWKSVWDFTPTFYWSSTTVIKIRAEPWKVDWQNPLKTFGSVPMAQEISTKGPVFSQFETHTKKKKLEKKCSKDSKTQLLILSFNTWQLTALEIGYQQIS